MIFPRRGSNREFTGVQILTGKVAEKLKTDIKKRASGEVKPLKALVYWGFPCIKDSVYIDDGYSGTTFDRPDFQRMVADVRAGLVKRVIIKDMSRFGRDYLQVCIYTEMIFPEYEVHFVAVNDGVDSQKGENDLTPFRNLFNEWYARDCSKKQRAVKRMKGMSGQRISSNPPYGYIKGEGGQLVPDPEAAWVVKLMFDLAAQGLGPVRIANILTKKKSPHLVRWHSAGQGKSGTTTRKHLITGLTARLPTFWNIRNIWATRSTSKPTPSLISSRSGCLPRRISK